MDRNAPIGVFDSGVGGISVLAECIRHLPGEDFIYFGDTLNAPYGTKTTEEVLHLSQGVADLLAGKGIKALVIACNTATAAAAEALREDLTRYPFPIIGMEPALKLAKTEVGEAGRVLVLATPSTIASEKYGRLLSRFGENTVSLPCPGLMEFAERLEFDTNELHRYLDELFQRPECRNPAAVVLGCTHYVFLKKAISRHTGALLVDGNEGTARQLIRKLQEGDLLRDFKDGQPGRVTLLTSGGENSAKIMQSLLKESLAI